MLRDPHRANRRRTTEDQLKILRENFHPNRRRTIEPLQHEIDVEFTDDKNAFRQLFLVLDRSTDVANGQPFDLAATLAKPFVAFGEESER